MSDRELVRHKSFIIDERTPEEAAFDLEQLDYDFLLFRDSLCGEDSVIERGAEGYVVRQLHNGSGGAAVPVLTMTEAREALEAIEATGARFLFFSEAPGARGQVLYRRYDGHYGLITLEGFSSTLPA